MKRSGYASAIPISSRGFSFFCVHAGQEYVLYLVFYVLQDEQDATKQAKRIVKRKIHHDMLYN